MTNKKVQEKIRELQEELEVKATKKTFSSFRTLFVILSSILSAFTIIFILDKWVSPIIGLETNLPVKVIFGFFAIGFAWTLTYLFFLKRSCRLSPNQVNWVLGDEQRIISDRLAEAIGYYREKVHYSLNIKDDGSAEIQVICKVKVLNNIIPQFRHTQYSVLGNNPIESKFIVTNKPPNINYRFEKIEAGAKTINILHFEPPLPEESIVEYALVLAYPKNSYLLNLDDYKEHVTNEKINKWKELDGKKEHDNASFSIVVPTEELFIDVTLPKTFNFDNEQIAKSKYFDVKTFTDADINNPKIKNKLYTDGVSYEKLGDGSSKISLHSEKETTLLGLRYFLFWILS